MAEQTNKKITIGEFQSWLQGVHDLQGEDWAPNTEQWKKIKEKFASIEGFDVPVERQITMLVERALGRIRWDAFVPQNTDWRQFNNAGGMPPAGATGAGAPGQPPANAINTAPPAGGMPVQQQPPVQMPPPGASSLTGATAATPPLTLPAGARVGNMDPNQAIRIEAAKTQDIDTSNGSYKSQFL